MSNIKSTGYTLLDMIRFTDPTQAKRFEKLKGKSRTIAIEGIVRHMRACAKNGINPDSSAIREIIDDALNGRRVFAESDDDTANVSRTHYLIGSKSILYPLDE